MYTLLLSKYNDKKQVEKQ